MIQIFPTRNIHLVAAYPTARMDLSICADWPPDDLKPTWTDLTTIPGVVLAHLPIPTPVGPVPATFVHRNAASNPSPTGLSVEPAAIGESFFRIVIAQGTHNVHAIIHVSTHADVDHLMLPYGAVYMFVGRDNYILTVFATFTDGENWDVTEHPWLEYGSLHPDIARVDGGRITAIAVGETQIWVQPIGRPTNRVSCTVHVATIASWREEADPKIVSRSVRRPAKRDRRLYLVGDGYDDRDRFERHIHEIADRVFNEANAPFRWVRDKFEVISLYVRSAGSRGISVGPPIQWSPTTGQIKPDEPGAVQFSGTLMYDPAHLNAFGLMFGARIGDFDAPKFMGANARADATLSWAGDTSARSISVDIRRMGPYRTLGSPVVMHDPRETFERELTAFLQELGLTLGPDDRVAFIVDDQMRGGAGFSVGGMELARRRFVSMTTGAFDDYFDGVASPPNPLAFRVPIADPYNADYVATGVVHELGHTYRLGDEYESVQNTGQTLASADQPRGLIEKWDNVQLKGDVIVNGRVDVSRLKWHVPRAKKVSVIKSITASASNLVITIDGDATRLWREFDLVRVRSSFARERPRDANHLVDATVPRLRDFAYRVDTVTASQIVLSTDFGGVSGDVSGLTVLYEPVFIETDPMLLIDPAVVAHLQDPSPGHGVFPRNVTPACTFTNDDGIPPAIANLKMPTVPADLVGIYEGGFQFSCGVIRPAGRCKMRVSGPNTHVDAHTVLSTEVAEFCFVCKFIIADQIDPTVLPNVQVHYPKDC